MASVVAASDPPTQALELGTRLYDAHAEMLLRFCRRRLRDASEAEDAVQTTFVYAIRALRRGVVPENEEAWLTSIATNVCHWQRRTDARRGALAKETELDAVADRRSAPGHHDELLGLDEALASIPEQQRRALLLREWRGVPPAEIARRLGLSPTATHALLTRARSSLAVALTGARQPVLALVWLVGELRSLVKAIVGSASAKAGVAAVTVVATTGGTAVLVEQSEAERTGTAPTPVLVDRAPSRQVGSTAASSVPARSTRRTAGAATRPMTTVRRRPAPGNGTARAVPSPSTPASAVVTDANRSGAPAIGSAPAPPPVRVPELPVGVPVPALPEVRPPSLPDVPSTPAPPAAEIPRAPSVPETVAGVPAPAPPMTGVLP